MYKVFLLFIIFLTLGCITNKQEKPINPHTENIELSKDSITKLKFDDTSSNENKKVIDTIIDTLEITDTIKETNLTEEIIKEKTIVKEKVKKEVDKKIRPNHTAWNLLTKKYVSSSGKVNYKGFKSNISQIETYLLHLQKTPPKKDWTKNEKLAYWFNLYNAATIQLISNAYPVKSIKDINRGKPWDKKFIKSGNKTYSLNQIENTIVRPNFNEPRLHVAFNCAAVSCPKLLNEAFTPSKLNSQLNKLSRAWINDPSKNKITANSIKISKIFEWYAIDFKKGVIPFINTYANVKANKAQKIQYLEYNWDLND